MFFLLFFLFKYVKNHEAFLHFRKLVARVCLVWLKNGLYTHTTRQWDIDSKIQWDTHLCVLLWDVLFPFSQAIVLSLFFSSSSCSFSIPCFLSFVYNSPLLFLCGMSLSCFLLLLSLTLFVYPSLSFTGLSFFLSLFSYLILCFSLLFSLTSLSQSLSVCSFGVCVVHVSGPCVWYLWADV